LFSLVCAAISVHAQLKVISTGNVGAKTTNPLSAFQINDSYIKTAFGSANNASLNWGTSYIGFNAVRQSNGTWLSNKDGSSANGGSIIYGALDGSIYFVPIASTGNTDQTNSDATIYSQKAMVISGNKNIGIGINTPNTLLHIHSNTGYSKSIQITNTSTGTTNSDGFIIRSGFTNNNDIELINQEATGSIFLYTANSKRIAIDPNGNLGIGISQPLYKVHVEYNDVLPGIYINKSNTTSNAMNIVSSINANLTKSIISINNGTSNFCVWGDGQVNVGGVYHDNNYKLTVYGSAYASGVFYSGSDIHFKQNITSIDNPIDKLNQINGKRYQYNVQSFPDKNFPQGFSYGVIAQEVQTVLPELVQADSAGYLAVNYDGLIPIIIEAVKEQQKTIKEQQEQINTLKDELSSCCSNGKTKDMMINNSNTSSENSKNAYLLQNIPNPFTAKTIIRYYIPEQTNNASLLIFDMQGKLIKTYLVNSRKEGYTEINGGEMQPGMYMYSLIIDGKELDTKRMILTE